MEKIINLVRNQHELFTSGITRSHKYRRNQLKRLQLLILENESAIIDAIHKDFGKAPAESYLSEIRYVEQDLKHTLKKLTEWMKPEKVPTPVVHYPANSYIIPEPYGVVLIISPWNYPFQLLFDPLIASIAAGNCTVLKPSELTPNTSGLIHKLINQYFKPEYVGVVEGAVDETTVLLQQPLDYIFFTGSTKVGKIIMQAAAKQLTPVTLELGGKSPCIVDKNTNIKISGRRIAWGKFLNAGQTCIAPDYVFVHKDIKEQIIDSISNTILEFYGQNPEESSNYARIVNLGHYHRLAAYLQEGKIRCGGNTNERTRYIAPTILDDVDWNAKVMQDEIFGPILPVMEFTDTEQMIKEITTRPKPLACYVFSKNKAFITKIESDVSAGGMCINDTISHIVSNNLPFGGVGDSGMGAYHGKHSFDTFTHYKSVMKRRFFLDLKLKYPPYQPIKTLKKLLRWVW